MVWLKDVRVRLHLNLVHIRIQVLTLENILENYTERRRLRVHGFNEEGSTTTPFEMLRRNGASRYDIAIDVAEVLGQDKLVEKYRDILESNHEHAVQFGEDLIK